MPAETPYCLYCQQNSDEVPLIRLLYRGQEHWICPQHFPILIHKPAQLADKLPGIENMGPPADH